MIIKIKLFISILTLISIANNENIDINTMQILYESLKMEMIQIRSAFISAHTSAKDEHAKTKERTVTNLPITIPITDTLELFVCF